MAEGKTYFEQVFARNLDMCPFYVKSLIEIVSLNLGTGEITLTNTHRTGNLLSMMDSSRSQIRRYCDQCYKKRFHKPEPKAIPNEAGEGLYYPAIVIQTTTPNPN